MKIKKLGSFIFLFLSICLLNAKETWVSGGNYASNNIKSIVKLNTNDKVSFTQIVPGIKLKEIIGKEIFHRITLEEGYMNTAPGSPELPNLRKIVAIPECSNLNIDYTIKSQKNCKNINVYPTPRYLKNNGVVVEEFYYDDKVYSTNSFINSQVVTINEIGHFREQRYVELFISPIQYNPVTKKLKIISEINVNLSFDKPSSDLHANLGIFDNAYSEVILNREANGTGAYQGNRNRGSVTQVEVTNQNVIINVIT